MKARYNFLKYKKKMNTDILNHINEFLDDTKDQLRMCSLNSAMVENGYVFNLLIGSEKVDLRQKRYKHVRNLRIVYNAHITCVDFLPLRTLSLIESPIREIKCADLEKLYISSMYADVMFVRNFSHFQRLTMLEIDVTYGGLYIQVDPPPRLEELRLRGTSLFEVFPASLRRVTLDKMEITEKMLQDCVELEEAIFIDTTLSESVGTFYNLNHLTRLRNLGIIRTEIMFFRFDDCLELEEMHIDSKYTYRLDPLKKLKRLRLAYQTDAHFTQCTALEELTLWDMSIGLDFSALSALKKLQNWGFSGSISDAAIRPCVNLEELMVNGRNGVTDVNHLKKLRILHAAGIGSGISDASFVDCPALEIVHCAKNPKIRGLRTDVKFCL